MVGAEAIREGRGGYFKDHLQEVAASLIERMATYDWRMWAAGSTCWITPSC